MKFLTVIGADGGVYACQDKAYTEGGRLSSIKDQSFESLWNSGELNSRMRDIAPSRHCRHHCVAHGKNLALHDILALDPAHLPFV